MLDRPRKHSAVTAALVLVLIAGALSACGSARHRDGFAGGRVRIAIPRDPSSLNPLISQTNDEFYVEEAIFDGLLKHDANGRLVPDLAVEVPTRANGGISADLKTITYRLRRNAAWQDGAPFTAADVAFTYRREMDDRVSSPLRSIYEQIAALQTPSPYTVVVRLRHASIAALGQIFVAGTGFIVPEHVLRGVADIRRSTFNAQPVGTGPFAVLSWKRGDYIDLAANPRYFGGAPRIRALRLLIEPNVATRVAQLKTGAIDEAPVSRNASWLLAGSRQIRILDGHSTNLFYLDLNARKAPLDSRDVRQGLAGALNPSQLAKELAGAGVPASSLFPAAPAGDAKEEMGSCKRDRIRAVSALRRRGSPLHIDVYYIAGPMLEGVALQLQQSLKRVGVDAALRAFPFGVLYGDRGLVVRGEYDVAIDGLGVADASDVMQIIGSRSAPPAGFNYTGYANRRVDRLMEAADTTYDPRARAALYAAVDGALCRDVPVIPLFWETYVDAVNVHLKGFAAEPMVSDLWNVDSWSLE